VTTPVLFWYRQDLRVDDLPGLAAAAATDRPVIPCFILDDDTPGHWRIGAASRWWLHHSLVSLSAELKEPGAQLVLRRGEPLRVLQTLTEETGAQAIYCTRMYEPWAAELEGRLHNHFTAAGITFKRYCGALLHEPESISNQSGQPYKVFTPYWRQCLAAPEPPAPQPLTADIHWYDGAIDSDDLADWRLCPSAPDWAAGWDRLWQPGSTGAAERLDNFLRADVDDYSEGRDHPAQERTTRLSAHIHHGEISPRAIWHRARRAAAGNAALEKEVEKFLSELGWREFSHYLLHHFPRVQDTAFKAPFDQFPWLSDDTRLRAWQRGLTGYPLVDAGMRELWQTGYMHNRVRMIVASFLTKHLLIHWRKGAEWFWDTLLDADLANNSCGWQWVAGSGADASPYFRIFNPVAQGKKFDVKGAYIRRWVPELSALPDKHLHAPWDAPAEVLASAGVLLGDTYPGPIVDHKAARESALAAYASLRT
jgi:deoxyribodipyrimidine photo-lyase